MTKKKIEIETSEKETGLKISKPKKNSVGVPAILSSMAQIAKNMNPAEGLKLSLKMNQKDGFDCPGCAWPDPDDDRSNIGEYCENGIKAMAEEATKRSIGSKYFADKTVSEISKLSDFELGKLGRLTEPMVLRTDQENYESITWESAFDLIAQHLNNLDTPDEAVFYTSGRTSNEAAYLYQLFVRAYGTNNLPDCSNMCHESSGVGLSETVGIGKGSVTLNDLHEAELIIVMGQNPGTNHPRMLSALEKCKENGGKIITVNPLPEAGLMNYTNPQSPLRILTNGVALTDLFLQVKVNGDVAALKAIMINLLQREDAHPGSVFDHDFITEYTEGYNELIKDLRVQDYLNCVKESGIPEKDIDQAANLIAQNSKIIICWAMGLTQHENGVDNIKEIVNLLLLKGAIGKPGAGTCPVRGHSNVQGDRTMGVWDAPKDKFLDDLDNYHGIKAPRKHGFSVVPAIKAMYKEKAKVFFAMGGNFLSATPDTHYTAQALMNCDLTVHVSTKLNRSHLVHGKEALILPCLGRTDKDVQRSGEQFVSCENSMGVVHSSKGILNPPSPHLKSEVSIVADLAIATLKSSTIDWQAYQDNYDTIRLAIGNVIPGFENYNERVRKPGGFYLPNGAREREFKTPSGKAQFTVLPIPKDELEPDDFIMMTIRSHDQFNTTIYGLNDRYRGIKNERRIVFMNEVDMKNLGLKEKDKVDLKNAHGGVERVVKKFIVVKYPIPEGNVATYFPEANPLVPIDSYAKDSLTPCSKRVVIKIQKST